MNRKANGILLIVFSLLFFKIVSADDASANPIFTAHRDKVTCVSVVNPESMPDGYFLLYDYSSKIGTELGRPWSIVEKGKCYEIDHSGGAIYVVKGGEVDKAKFRNLSLYTPDQNIEIKTYKNKEGAVYQDPGTPYSFDDVVYEMFPSEGQDYVEGSSGQDYYLRNSYLPYIIPTKYEFGENITFTSAMGSMYENPTIDLSGFSKEEIAKIKVTANILHDPRYNKQILDLYSTLAENLTTTLNSCDNRTRVEYQINLSNKSINQKQIWKLKDGSEVTQAVNEYSWDDQVGFVSQIGCKDAYINFIQSNKSIIDAIDNLAEAILKDNKAGPDEETISINKNQTKILAFIAGTYSPEKLSEDRLMRLVSLYEPPFPDFLNIKENNVTTISTQPTVLEEPTSEKKMDEISHSGNKLFKIYTVLPILGIIVMVFIVRKKKQ